MKTLPLIVACFFACRPPFDGRLSPVDVPTAVETFRAVHALDKLDCSMLRITEGGLEVRMHDGMVRNPQTGREVCGYYDGAAVFGRVDGVCSTLLHEVAHAMGYGHRVWPPLMWERPPWLPIEEQARQFIELTGCEL